MRKEEKVYCSNCFYFKFGYYCDSKKGVAPWRDRPKKCDGYCHKDELDIPLNRMLNCHPCKYLSIEKKRIYCLHRSLSPIKKQEITLTSKIKRKREKDMKNIPKWCPEEENKLDIPIEEMMKCHPCEYLNIKNERIFCSHPGLKYSKKEAIGSYIKINRRRKEDMKDIPKWCPKPLLTK